MGRLLSNIRPRVPKLDTRIPTAEKRADKRVDPELKTKEHSAWRDAVVRRAGARCEAVDQATGERCDKAEPLHRMFADHIVERADGGARSDIYNGQCLCGSHHTIKTNIERARRAGLLTITNGVRGFNP